MRRFPFDIFLCFLLSIIAIFYGIGKHCIFIFDEAIYANNALDMIVHNDYINYTVNGEPNLYNTKPPLVIYLQVLFIKLLGPTELAIRLPSVLSALGIIVMMFYFIKELFPAKMEIWILASLMLVSSQGFMINHVVRSGDLDAVLSFWLIASLFITFHFSLKNRISANQYIYIQLCLFLSAYFTKSTASFFIIPGTIIILIYSGKLLKILKNYRVYLSFIIYLIVIGAFYYIKEIHHQGFWEQVWYSEFHRIIEDVMPWHSKPFIFYIDNLVSRKYFFPYVILLLPAVIFSIINYKKSNNKTVITILIAIFSYYLVISFPKTKLPWYDATLYPLLSIVVAVFVTQLINKYIPKYKSHMLVIIYLFLSYNTIKLTIKNQSTEVSYYLENESIALKKLKEISPSTKQFQLLFTKEHDRHSDQAMFYTTAFNHFNDYNIKMIHQIDDINTTPSSTVLFCRDVIPSGYTILQNLNDNCKLVKY